MTASTTATRTATTDPRWEWTRERIRRLREQTADPTEPVPSYNSDGWTELPDDDPRRWIAILTAAEAWRRDSNPHRLAVRLELDLESAARADADAHEQWRDVAGLVRAGARSPRHQQLVQRRRTPTGGRDVVDSDRWPAITRPGTWTGERRCVA